MQQKGENQFINIYKKTVAKIVAVILLVTIIFYAVGCDANCKSEKNKVTVEEGFSVHFIDVGDGDATFIRFPDGENVLIDCGENDLRGVVYKKIKQTLDAYKVQTIDYLVITHTDSDHTGNFAQVVNDYEIKKAFLPKVTYKESYPSFNEGYTVLCKKYGEDCIDISDIHDRVGSATDGNYYMIFLCPNPTDFSESAYNDFNATENPSSTVKNNISPIIYLQYDGVRFLLAGDAETEPQQNVLTNYKLGLYKNFGVSLENIDFYKVAHHGAKNAVNTDFLNLIKCKNAVVSASGDKSYEHPSDYAIEKLYEANNDYSLFRTDTMGSISVFVKDGAYRIEKESD